MDYIATVSSAVMALVWIVYFQLFFLQYQRNNRPYLVIHHAQNENPDALCLLVNMGKETVHVQCVQVVLFTRAGEEKIMTVTEYRRIQADDSNVHQVLRQGPLQSGGYLVLGSFRNIILGRRSEEADPNYLFEDIVDVEIRAAVIHGPSKYPVGVRRRFTLRHEGGPVILPRNIYSEQLVKRKDRHQVRRWVEDELRPERKGRSESETSDQSR
ncbi:hypothetical protein SAMN05216429_104128 [Marinobacter persicus]|uniref:Uncharacterized protein n=1 Tax=Marinobacter persicus TaxID=930118 RepID=A0A1I3SYP8_9GAMM|nr:hypothetical protein [Marinobacter persicus]GHD40766.1 hypothetical protein GCM10008110_02010 [Marinobacter persicus]SFJ63342.1 hypothetical protein SAMN05216429_104128 [Marinobacter persicus]